MNKDFLRAAEQSTEKAIDALKTPEKAQIIQHGEGSQVVQITHEGDGDIVHQDTSELNTLRMEVKMYKSLLEEKIQCTEENNKIKNDEIRVLKDTISILKQQLK